MFHGFLSFQKKKGQKPFSLFLGSQVIVNAQNQFICIGTVYGTRHFNALASGRRATQAMHTDFKEELCGFGCCVQNVTDNAFFGYDHDILSPFSVSFFSIIPTFPLNVNRYSKKQPNFFTKSALSKICHRIEANEQKNN
jgi:hypothetical protein